MLKLIVFSTKNYRVCLSEGTEVGDGYYEVQRSEFMISSRENFSCKKKQPKKVCLL